MNSTSSYLRVIGYMIVAFILFELLIDGGNKMAIMAYPILWLVLLVLLFIAVAFEITLSAVKNTMYRALPEDAKARYKENESNEKLKAWYRRMLDTKPIEKEDAIIMDHEYDGIRELDNNLPPWWKYLFYITIVFAAGYMLYYHVFDGPTQEMEYDKEMADAAIAIEKYKKDNPDLIDASTVELLTDASDLKEGESIFMQNCSACHRADGGGGIGPNLTDDYWILGGDIASIYTVISEGGRAGKGMVSWKNDLNPLEIAQVSSYIISLSGTNPPDAKAPEGDYYEREE